MQDDLDNCPHEPNPDQLDTDGDKRGISLEYPLLRSLLRVGNSPGTQAVQCFQNW